MKVYDKLVRDRIPEIIKDEGRTPVTRILERDDFIEYLLKKFPEELKEVQEAKGENEHFIEELADLLELTLSLAEHTNLRIDLAQVEFSPDHELLQDDLLSLLVTQVNELIETGVSKEVIRDIINLIGSLSQAKGVDLQNVEEVRRLKAKERGRFEKRILLEGVEEG